MGLKKNIAYSGLLTVSLYILQFITFPYVARVLGVANIGIYDFCYSYVNIFLLVSSFGISVYGIREVAKANSHEEKLNQTFTTLFSYNALLTTISIILYIVIWLSSDNLKQYNKLLASGIIILLSNLFVVEWLFRGVEDFKYVTYRTLSLRVIYCLSVFIFVREQDDYDTYFYLSVLLVLANALINWHYKNRYVTFHRISFRGIRSVIAPSVLVGGYVFLSSYYSNILPVILGSLFDNTQVGLYVTASKLIIIIIMLFGAYTLALIPRLSSYNASNQVDLSKSILAKSYCLVMLFIVPCIFFVGLYADDIILFIAGPGYEEAAGLMRLCLPILFISGINQINVSQVLLPKGKDKYILFIYMLALPSGLLINYLLSFYLKAESSVISWVFIEFLICIISSQKIYKDEQVNVLNFLPWKAAILFLPLLSLLYFSNFVRGSFVNICIGIVFILIWTHFTYKYILKDDIYISIVEKLTKKTL